jgi:hypothetical protein
MTKRILSRWMRVLAELLNKLWRGATAPPEEDVADVLLHARECHSYSVMV